MLEPLTTNIKKKNLFAFDIETYSDKNNFLMGSIYGVFKNYKKSTNKEYEKIIDKVFWDKLEFIDYILNNHFFYDNSYITATNLGFDFLALFEDTDILPYFNLILRGSNLITAKYKHKTRKNSIKFIDTINFCKLSVKQMGKIIRLEKLPQPICFKNKPKDETERIELENYNKRDTRITYEFIKMLQNGFNDLGATMKVTIASTSMDLFKRKYLTNILIQNKNTIKSLYKAYYGARVEVLKRGYVKDLKYYDYNSLYPSVMIKDYPYPNSEKYLKKCNYKMLFKYEGIVKATVSIKNIELPYLPYRQMIGNSENYKLIFPIGIFTGYYTYYELRNAIRLGYQILELEETIYYTKTFKPFYNYVKTLFPLKNKYKKEKNNMSEVIKLNLNSLYGKFAQKIDNKEEIYHIDYLDEKTFNEYINNSKLYKTIFKGNYLYVTKKIEPYISTFIIPIFSIYTTAYSRTKLYNKIMEIGVDNVYYYDTDSIVTNKILNTSDELGELKMEYIINEGEIIAPKMYFFRTDIGDIIKVKGIPKLKNREDFINLINTKKIVYDKFVKFKEANSRELKYNQIIQVEKNLTLEDTKRIWNDEFDFFNLQNSKPINIYSP